jgi:hypothetical protein
MLGLAGLENAFTVVLVGKRTNPLHRQQVSSELSYILSSNGEFTSSPATARSGSTTAPCRFVPAT